MARPKNFTAKTLDLDYVPPVPINRRLCVTCQNPMRYAYAWKPSEHEITYMFVCHCGTGSKVKLMHFSINSRGGLEG